MMVDGLDQFNWCRKVGCWLIGDIFSEFSLCNLSCRCKNLRDSCTFDLLGLDSDDDPLLNWMKVWLRPPHEDVNHLVNSCSACYLLILDTTSQSCCADFDFLESIGEAQVARKFVFAMIR